MSPTIKTTYSRQEIREVRETFREWLWDDRTIEPDGRVTVLYQAQTHAFLCRCQHGWFWAADAGEFKYKASTHTPLSWNAAMRDLGGGRLRVPTEQELNVGGFRVTVDNEPATFERAFTTTELDELEDEFGHRVWRAESEEPDALVTVLYDETERGAARWLVRVGTGWAWASSHGDQAGADPWDAIQRWMERTGRALRIPDHGELEAGGWTITSAEGVEEQAPDEAKEQIDAGFRALDVSNHQDASARFLAAIATSLYDLVGLHKKYDVDNLRVEVDPGPDEAQEVRSAAGDPEQPIREPEDGPGSGFTPVDDEVGGVDYPYAR